MWASAAGSPGPWLPRGARAPPKPQAGASAAAAARAGPGALQQPRAGGRAEPGRARPSPSASTAPASSLALPAPARAGPGALGPREAGGTREGAGRGAARVRVRSTGARSGRRRPRQARPLPRAP